MANSSSIGGLAGRFDQRRGGLELGRLSGELLAGVVLREVHLQRAGLAGADAIELLLEARNELAGADHDLDAFAGAAVEQFAVDAALEVDGHAIAVLGLGAFGLRGIGTVLVGDTLDRLVDLGVGDLDHRLLHREGLEIGELDRRHHFDRDRVGQIGLAGEQFLDFVLSRSACVIFGSVARRKPRSVKICVLVSRMVWSMVSAITERP